MRLFAIAACVAAVLVAADVAVRVSSGSKAPGMVWCVGPGEVVDARFKQEYPDLYMPKAVCDAVTREVR